MEKQGRIVVLDWMKAVSIFCVMITHTDLYGRGIPINYMLNCLIVEMAVPVFMIISGYNITNKQIENGINVEEKCGGNYINALRHQIFGIIPSYTLIFIVEMGLLIQSGQVVNSDWKYFVLFYIAGGRGPGGYYVPIMVQLFLIMPIIAFIIRKRPLFGLFSVCAINILFEMVVRVVPFPDRIYRLFIGRYLFLLAMGSFIRVYQGKKIRKECLFGSLAIGLTYIFVTNYFRLPNGTYSWSLFKYWQITAFPVAFYLFPFIYLLIENLSDIQIKNRIGIVMQKIGSRTWYIYCVQILYFLIVYETYGFKYLLRELPLVFEFFISFLLCIGGGFFLYYLEKWVKKRISG